MRLSRRALVTAGGAGALGFFGARHVLASGRGSDAVTSIDIRARPISSFASGKSERRFGSLTFRSGLVLNSDFSGFGGLSGLWRSPDGSRLVAVSDNAQWLTAAVNYEGERLSGLSDAVMAPILGVDSRPLRHTKAYDTESLAIADGIAYVGIERVHEVRRFDWAGSGVRARGIPIPVPPEVKRLPSNDSLEAVGVPPKSHPLAGNVIAIAENSRSGDDTRTQGWVLTGARRFTFDVARSKGFDVTDVAFLPSGEALLLERRFRILSGVACRMRRLAPDAFRPGGLVDGPVIFEADMGQEIDNMEGLAVHRDRDSGATILTLISDDNFSALQRTLLLEFELV